MVFKGRSPSKITSTTASGGNPTICTGFQVRQRRQCAGRVTLPVALLIFIFIFTDREYLHKGQDGNVFLHNAETREESLYLSNSTFVRCFSRLHFTHNGKNISDLSIVSSQAQVEATDYLLSGDYRYVAFESNYTKVRKCPLFKTFPTLKFKRRETVLTEEG